MKERECPFCYGISYAVQEYDNRICPYCGIDASLVLTRQNEPSENQGCYKKTLVELVSDFKKSDKTIETKIKDNILYLNRWKLF